MPGKKVFVSSTCYDLIDLRAELEVFLRKQGYSPVFSDSATSDFQVLPDRDSIETCLMNVRACDVFVMILSQRYGPSLGGTGYDDISATHLEYRTAKEQEKDIFVYIRDRLLNDYDHWKDQQRPTTFQSRWLPKEQDLRLLPLIDEHSELVIGNRSNWRQAFKSSVDLKEFLFKDLRTNRPDILLNNLISNNTVPDLRIECRSYRAMSDRTQGDFNVVIYNNGGVHANNIAIMIRKENRGEVDRKSLAQFIRANDQFAKDITLPIQPREMPVIAILRYYTQTGYTLEDVFELAYDSNNLPLFVFKGKRIFSENNIVLTGPLYPWDTYETLG